MRRRLDPVLALHGARAVRARPRLLQRRRGEDRDAIPAGGSDFVTAPELTPLFAQALARPVAAVLADGVATVLELGGGSGRARGRPAARTRTAGRRCPIATCCSTCRPTSASDRPRRWRTGVRTCRRGSRGSTRCRIGRRRRSSPTRCSMRCRSNSWCGAPRRWLSARASRASDAGSVFADRPATAADRRGRRRVDRPRSIRCPTATVTELAPAYARSSPA